MRLNGVLPSCVAFRPSGVLGVLLLCVLVALTGCSSKNITSKGPFVSVSYTHLTLPTT